MKGGEEEVGRHMERPLKTDRGRERRLQKKEDRREHTDSNQKYEELSPLRKARQENNRYHGDISPPRKGKTEGNRYHNDKSPSRKDQKDSNRRHEELSPFSSEESYEETLKLPKLNQNGHRSMVSDVSSPSFHDDDYHDEKMDSEHSENEHGEKKYRDNLSLPSLDKSSTETQRSYQEKNDKHAVNKALRAGGKDKPKHEADQHTKPKSMGQHEKKATRQRKPRDSSEQRVVKYEKVRILFLSALKRPSAFFF